MAKKKNNVDPLEPVRRAPLSVKVLCLCPAQLGHKNIDYEPTPTFPREVLACKNLESLELFRGIDYRGDNTIPKEIGKLTKLTSLGLGGLQMKSLPDSIGDLKNLRELSLDYAEALTSLPKTLGKLVNLEKLSLSETEKLKSLPESIGGLKKLKELVLSGEAMKSVPGELWKLKALETLELPVSVQSLPAGISALSSLKSLSLSAKALASLADELSKMTKLESVHVLQVDERSQTLAEAIGRVPNLKSLRVAFTGLSSIPKSLAGHPFLEELDVAGNSIEELEALVVSLPKLAKLDFMGTAIDRAQKRRIDALMKLSPSKRRANTSPAPQLKSLSLKHVGRVSAVNASLSLLVADERVARQWNGSWDGSDDFDRMCDALKKKDVAPLKVGSDDALAVTLGMCSGTAEIYRIGEALVLVEGTMDDWKDASFLEDLATPRDAKAKKVGRVVVKTKLAILSGTDRLADKDGKSFVVKTPTGAHDLFFEEEKSASWGSARRAWIVQEVKG